MLLTSRYSTDALIRIAEAEMENEIRQLLAALFISAQSGDKGVNIFEIVYSRAAQRVLRCLSYTVDISFAYCYNPDNLRFSCIPYDSALGTN